MIVVSIGTQQLDKFKAKMNEIEKDIKPALARAMNRAVKSGLTAVSRITREKYVINKGALDSTFTQKYATSSDLNGEIRSRYTGMLRAHQFRLKPSRRLKTPKTLSLETRRGSAGTLGRSFIGLGNRVFARKSDSAYPLEEKFGPSAPIMVSQSHVAEPAHERMVEIFDRRFDHELNRLLG
jgi:hypothetical protein